LLSAKCFPLYLTKENATNALTKKNPDNSYIAKIDDNGKLTVYDLNGNEVNLNVNGKYLVLVPSQLTSICVVLPVSSALMVPLPLSYNRFATDCAKEVISAGIKVGF
jgi:hypothetical protein